MEAFGRFDALHWMNGRNLARHERGTHGNGSANDGFNNADRHDGFDNADRHDGFNSVHRHDGFNNADRHDGFNSVDHHDQFNNVDHHDGEDNVDMDDEILNKWDVEQEEKYDKTMVEMFQEAHTPLYQGCSTIRLATILLLLNLITTHGVNNTFLNKIFTLLRIELFPKDNTLPKSMYQVKRVVRELGLSYNSIHA